MRPQDQQMKKDFYLKTHYVVTEINQKRKTFIDVK